jgi:hypothetical protein
MLLASTLFRYLKKQKLNVNSEYDLCYKRENSVENHKLFKSFSENILDTDA